MTYAILPAQLTVSETAGTLNFTLQATSLNAPITLYVSVVGIGNSNVSSVYMAPFAVTLTPDASGNALVPFNAAVINNQFQDGTRLFAIVLLPNANANPLSDFIVRSLLTVNDDDIPTNTDDDYPDNLGQATTLGGQLSPGPALTGNIGQLGDHDFFKTYLTTGVTYQFGMNTLISATGGLSDPEIFLYKFDGPPVAYNDDNAGSKNALVTYTPTVTGFYYLDAHAHNDAGTGTYQVTMDTASVATSTGDDYANDISTLSTMAAGDTIHGNIEVGGDKDWLKISLVAGKAYSISLNGAASTSGTLYDPFLTLYDSHGTAVGSDDDSGTGNDALLNYTPTVSGTYYVEARAFNPAAKGTYELSVKDASAPVSGDDHGATASTAGTIQNGQTVTGTIETGNDKDWFKFTSPQGADTSYTIELKGMSSHSGTLYDPYLKIYSASSGEVVATDDDSGTGHDALLHFTMSAGQTYFIEAGSFSPIGTGIYELTMNASSGGASASGDLAASTATTGVINVGQTISSTIETGGDKDWIKFTVADPGSYQIALNGAATTSGTLYDPFVSLYDSTGALVASDDDSGVGHNSLLQFAASAAGTYFIEARSFGASGTGTYQVTLSTVGGGGGDLAASTATTGVINVGQTIGSAIDTGGDKDWFKFTVADPGSYQIALNGAATTSGTLYDPFVSLYDSNGTFIASDDDSGVGHNSLLQFTASAAGTYFIEARAFSAAVTGTYQLEVELVGTAP